MLIQGIHHICIKCDKSEIEKVKNFYGDVLGMPIVRSWGEEVTEGLMFDTGAGLIEVFTNATTPLPQGAVRHFALRTGDVDKCVEYLQVNGSLICDKTVRDTVRGYLKGEIDITIKEVDLAEQIEENKEIISENEQKISDELVGTLIEQQDKIKSQQTEIANIKKKEVGTYGE